MSLILFLKVVFMFCYLYDKKLSTVFIVDRVKLFFPTYINFMIINILFIRRNITGLKLTTRFNFIIK